MKQPSCELSNKFLPAYLDTLLTKEEKDKWNTLICTSSSVTIKYYPPEASFLIEHDRKIIGPIPEHILQEGASDDYKRFLVKHTKLPQELLNRLSWDLLGEATSKLNLAKLLPMLKLINNEWSTGTKCKNTTKRTLSAQCVAYRKISNMSSDAIHQEPSRQELNAYTQ